MGNLLRDIRSPSELAANGQLIEFSEELCEFEHLAGIVEADLLALEPAKMPRDWRKSIVAGQLEFAVASAHAGLPVLKGQVTATIYAVCQRCLEPFRMPLKAGLQYAFVDVAESCDPSGEYAGFDLWELAGETLRPLDLVEEALIMELPFATMHSDMADCNMGDFAGQETMTGSGEKTARPFAALKEHMEN